MPIGIGIGTTLTIIFCSSSSKIATVADRSRSAPWANAPRQKCTGTPPGNSWKIRRLAGFRRPSSQRGPGMVFMSRPRRVVSERLVDGLGISEFCSLVPRKGVRCWLCACCQGRGQKAWQRPPSPLPLCKGRFVATFPPSSLVSFVP